MRPFTTIVLIAATSSPVFAEGPYVFRKGPVYGTASCAEQFCTAVDMAARSGKVPEADLALMEAECNRLTALEKPDFSGLIDAMNNPPPSPDRLDELEQHVKELEGRLDELEE